MSILKNRAHFSTKNKCYKPRKPDFVSTLSFICDCNCLQPVAAYPGSLGGPPCSEPLHGITAPKVYPSCTLLHKTVSSYLTFSPSCSRFERDHSYFLWHYLLSLVSDSRLFTGGLPCAVRTFLNPAKSRTTIARVCSKCKNIVFSQKAQMSANVLGNS